MSSLNLGRNSENESFVFTIASSHTHLFSTVIGHNNIFLIINEQIFHLFVVSIVEKIRFRNRTTGLRHAVKIVNCILISLMY